MSENSNNCYQPDIRHFHENWCNFPQEELRKYVGKYLAWSPDGTRILASGDTEEAVEELLKLAGIDPSQVVGDFIPPFDSVIL